MSYYNNTTGETPFTPVYGYGETSVSNNTVAKLFRQNRNGYGLPTDRQISFAHAIETALQIPLPDEPTFENYRKYIADNADAFYKQEGNKVSGTKHIDVAGVITIDKEDTVFDVLDKFFYGGEKFINENSVTYYYGDNSFVEIHNDLGNMSAMQVLNESIKFANEDKEKKNENK